MINRHGRITPDGPVDEEFSDGSVQAGACSPDLSLPGPPFPGQHAHGVDRVDVPDCVQSCHSAGSLQYSPGRSERNRHRMPSSRPITGNLPDCQAKYDRIFSKPLLEIKRNSLLPVSKRESFKQDQPTIISRWQRRKFKQKQTCSKIATATREIGYRVELWRNAIKAIEGHHGSGVVSYFYFLRWLFRLNVLISLLMIVFVVIPQLSFIAGDSDNWLLGNETSSRLNESAHCSSLYRADFEVRVLSVLLDFLQGTGWMEQTFLYYGKYTEKTLLIGPWNGVTYFYSLPLAYFVVTVAIFGMSLFLMVKKTAEAFQSSVTDTDTAASRYGSVVFASWDFALYNGRIVKRKHRNLYNEIITNLHEDREVARRRGQDLRAWCHLSAARLAINLFVVLALGACGCGIYFATQESLKFKERPDYARANNFVQLLMEYIPSLTITSLNLVVPKVFATVVKGEDLSPITEIQITLARTIFLRLSSLAVLLGTLYSQVTCPHKDAVCGVGILKCPAIKCWETYVGQQIYKLVVLDFFFVGGKVFLLDYPRRVLVEHCDCAFTRWLGKPEFELPREILSLVHSQILCWLGAFFSPMLPVICVVLAFIMFYLKKLTCIYNHVPPSRMYRAARSHVFFMLVLIAAFILCCLPVGYIIWRIAPSKSCGPFRLHDAMFDIVTMTIAGMPEAVRRVMSFLTSAAVVVPGFVVLVLAIYYCTAVANARKEKVRMFKDQLVLERKDKKFLLARMQDDRANVRQPQCEDSILDLSGVCGAPHPKGSHGDLSGACGQSSAEWHYTESQQHLLA